MSSQRGNVNKSAQKHRNNIAFKLDKYGTSPRIEKVKQAPTDGMCPRYDRTLAAGSDTVVTS